jgi:carbamoyltransferase
MLVLGLFGGIDLLYQNRDFLVPYYELHDSAAALVEDGKIVAAIEEERLNRIKHTNKGPVSAIRFCLDRRGASLSDIDKLIVVGDERLLAKFIRYRDMVNQEGEPAKDPRGLIHDLLLQGMNDDIDDSKISFVRHHVAHAISAYAVSGFDHSLIFTMDGGGDDNSGIILNASRAEIQLLRSIPISSSLGLFYLNVTQYLGYRLFDEYKVMGLAPYGDPSKYRKTFKEFYELLPQGEYRLKMTLPDDLLSITQPRKRHYPITQVHKDIAAALQESLEEIVFHILTHFMEETGQRNLCLAGGVAHNCTLNGKLLYKGFFDKVFVQPASHDGGLCLGAALSPFLEQDVKNIRHLEHVFLGTDIGGDELIREALSCWEKFLEFELKPDIAETTARLLAEGEVIGWVQGRSEFGPRALGNRSIVADPRPAENREIINAMVKKREAYRPFAPAVLDEYAHEYFELAADPEYYAFMTMIVKVREDKAALLGATTHVDRTARIQTVSKATNRRFWELIDAFRRITGVPVLLNTSFNNNVEPIVDSVNDAIVCFLTTKLDSLVVGDYLIRKKECDDNCYLTLIPSLPVYTTLNQRKHYVSSREMDVFFEIGNTIHKHYNITISREVFDLLREADGQKCLATLFDRVGIDIGLKKKVLQEVLELWSRRVVHLTPIRF